MVNFVSYPKKQQLVLLLLSIGLFTALVIWRIVNMDMFFDGVIYASIARNMAEGFGSFWHPYYTENFLNPFYEHPPLQFWLQSMAYNFFGTSRLVEFFWGVGCGAIIVLLTVRIWKLISKSGQTTWLPIFLFAVIPTVPWTFCNNMLENTMTVFTTASVFFIFKAWISKKRIFIYALISGAFIVSAFLSKGPTALFPLAVPFILSLFWYNDDKNFRWSFLFFSCLGIMIGILILGLVFYFSAKTDVINFFANYLDAQIFKSIKGEREQVRHSYLVYRFLGELVVPVFVCFVAYIFFKTRRSYAAISNVNKGAAIALLLIAVSASFPTFFSPKQRIWYLFASWPFYVLTISLTFENLALNINEKLNSNLSKLILSLSAYALFAFTLVTVVFFSGVNFKRVPTLYSDVISQNIQIPKRQIMSVCPKKLSESWEILSFMQRYYSASFTSANGAKYLFTDLKDEQCSKAPKSCSLLNSGAKQFALYSCEGSK